MAHIDELQQEFSVLEAEVDRWRDRCMVAEKSALLSDKAQVEQIKTRSDRLSVENALCRSQIQSLITQVQRAADHALLLYHDFRRLVGLHFQLTMIALLIQTIPRYCALPEPRMTNIKLKFFPKHFDKKLLNSKQSSSHNNRVGRVLR